MTRVLIECWGMGDGSAGPVGQFLERYDLNAHSGLGEAWWTTDTDKAMKFKDGAEAMTAWRAASTVKPVREDGRPNRPLTAYSITFTTIPEKGDHL